MYIPAYYLQLCVGENYYERYDNNIRVWIDTLKRYDMTER